MEVRLSPYLTAEDVSDGMKWCRIQAEIMTINMDLSREMRKPGSGWRESPVKCEECSNQRVKVLWIVSFTPILRGKDCLCGECGHRFSVLVRIIPPDPLIRSNIVKMEAKLRKLDELLKVCRV